MRFFVYDKIGDASTVDIERLSHLCCQQRVVYSLTYKNVLEQWLRLKSFECLSFLLPDYFNERTIWQTTSFGKPYIEGAEDFSISHCKRGLSVVVHDGSVGIDIEDIYHLGDGKNHPQEWKEKNELLIRKTMNVCEEEIIMNSSQPHIVFFTLWTQKEAYFKFTGTGINDDMRDILSYARLSYPATIIRSFHFQGRDYIISVAYRI